MVEPETNALPDCSGRQNAQSDDGAMSHDNSNETMTCLQGAADVDQPLESDSLKAQVTEAQIRGLVSQASTAESEFERLGVIKYIDEAIQCWSMAVALTPQDHETKPGRLARLALLFYRRFDQLDRVADLDKAIECLSQAVLLTPNDDLDKPARLNNLGNTYRRRFERLGSLADVDKAIECLGQALSMTPPTPNSHTDKATRLNNLGISHLRRFEHHDEPADLDKGIDCLSQALQLCPGGHEGKAGWLNNIGISFLRRFERLRNVTDLGQAIDHLNQAMLIIPDGHRIKRSVASNLGSSYLSRFMRLGNISDVDKAIELQNQAVLVTPNGHADKPAKLNNLGNSCLRRFDRLGELADLDRAIDCHSQALKLIQDGHASRPGWLKNLGNSYRSRFERLGQLPDIDQAIQCQVQAVMLTPEGHADKPAQLNDLGGSCRRRFEYTGDHADVDKAIEYQIKAVILTPDNHPDKPSRLNSLGSSYQSRFQHTGNVGDVDKAIDYYTQAVLPTPDSHASKPSWLNNLGSACLRRFEHLGNIENVDNAIAYHIQAVTLTPAGHADRPGRLSNLGLSYKSRFKRLGELEDVNQGIEYQTQAVRLAPEGHAGKPGWLNNLGVLCLSRFERLGKVRDVDKAIECLSEAVTLTPDGHSVKPTLLDSLGSSYLRRFERSGQLADVGKAVEHLAQAVLLTPDGHATKPSRLNNLGISHRQRFEHLDILADLDKAIECQIQAVALTPEGFADKPGWLHNLAISYLTRFKRFRQHADLECAQSSFQLAAQHIITDPETQIGCARRWADLCPSLDLSPEPAYERCMALIPHLIWLGTTIHRRYSLVTEISDLATEAAAWAISVKAYDLALEWLEEGRSIVWNQILQLRTPFDTISAVDPELAQHLKDIAFQLEGAGSRQTTIPPINMPLDLEKEAQHHRRLATEWEKCLGEARKLPGFQHFMQPRKAAELKLAATSGPVILINTHSTRSDALIIFPQRYDVVHVPLPLLSLQKATENIAQPNTRLLQRGDLDRGLILRKHEPDDPLKATLITLWSSAVHPILESLACTRKKPLSELPHLTWCVTGALAFLPLHAAGPYCDEFPLNTFDLVISSYTPTLSALLASHDSDSKPDAGLLAVGHDYAHGPSPLPCTVQELAAIQKHIQATEFLQLDNERATVDAVLRSMDEHCWVHLACHASQNPDNPTHSAFQLWDGDLTLEAINKCQFKNKGLAFLSACQTAKGDGKLPDEAVHLAAGMLMAGYPSVIATMWSIADIDGPEVAGRVYQELLKDGKMNHREAARALHQAVGELREKIGVNSFERWVPFIHIGV